MQAEKIGALILFESNVGLKSYAETGVALDSLISSHLLIQLFHPKTPLHDGAVIISKDKIVAAACTLPVANPMSQKLGLRHRAAIGVCAETDAFVVVVSEETGSLSVVSNEIMLHAVDFNELRMKLEMYYLGRDYS
jgi:diadenylate cyclase